MELRTRIDLGFATSQPFCGNETNVYLRDLKFETKPPLYTYMYVTSPQNEDGSKLM